MPDPSHSVAPPFDRATREALAGEILGASVAVHRAPGRAVPLRGTLVDETLSTFVIRPVGRGRTVRIPKAGLEGTIVLPSGELPLRGDFLRVRPEDRTKRLLAVGPKRLR